MLRHPEAQSEGGQRVARTFVQISVQWTNRGLRYRRMRCMGPHFTPRLRILAIVAGVLITAAFVLMHDGRAVAGHPAAAAAAAGCPSPYPATRNPSNPLDLPAAPGTDPLTGAHFTVPGPYTGEAAGAIAQLLGINPKTLAPTESWAQFEQQLQSGPLHARLVADPALAQQVDELALVAGQPDAQRLSAFTWGGTPSGLYKQTLKVFCQIAASDPGTIPIIDTYFLHPELGGCPTARQITADMPKFKSQIDAIASATGSRPAVFLLEIDAIGSSRCMFKHGSMPEWEAALRYEMTKLQALPHTVVYVEGGYSDANSVGYTAKVLNAIAVRKIRGFYTNDTHEQWTSHELRWATSVSAETHGAHFIVDTAENGRGPLLNRHPSKNGVEDLCNPPGRGLGIEDTVDTGSPDADAFLWTHPPGNSSGACNGGPPAGVFWPQRAESEAAQANDQLGPGYPSKPYQPPAM